MKSSYWVEREFNGVEAGPGGEMWAMIGQERWEAGLGKPGLERAWSGPSQRAESLEGLVHGKLEAAPGWLRGVGAGRERQPERKLRPRGTRTAFQISASPPAGGVSFLLACRGRRGEPQETHTARPQVPVRVGEVKVA